MNNRPNLPPEESKLSYAKYYDLPVTPVPPEKLAILKAGPMDHGRALPIERRNDLFLPGYLDSEIGYCLMPDGTGYLANHTIMPNVTVEMFDWWFAWHSLKDLRYKIWDPDDHFYARSMNPVHARDEKLPMRERTWGTSHDVLEDIGPGPDRLIIEFERPEILGYDADKVGTEYCATIMAANGHSPEPGPGSMAAVMTHFVRKLDIGIELRSRFWIGYQILKGQPIKVVPDGVKVPLEAVQGLFAHNLKEFGHLSTVLPMVYAEEKNRW